MKKTLVFLLLPLWGVLLAFDFQMFLGYSYGSGLDGWTVGTGFYQQPFGSDVMITFRVASPTTLFAFHISGFIPVFDFGEMKMGPAVLYLHEDFSGGWKDSSWVGIVIEDWKEDYHARIALLYPTQGAFDFSRDLVLEFRYFLKPPKGYVFKDRLYFGITYTGGIFRFGVGLLEPLP